MVNTEADTKSPPVHLVINNKVDGEEVAQVMNSKAEPTTIVHRKETVRHSNTTTNSINVHSKNSNSLVEEIMLTVSSTHGVTKLEI